MKIEIIELIPGKFFVNQNFISILKENNINSPQDLWEIKGESVKKYVKERGTERAFLNIATNTKLETYIKRYLPLPFKERLKCATSFKSVIMLGAIHEWEAICAFHAAEINTMIPIAAGILPDGRSVNITQAITGTTRASDILNNQNDLTSKHRNELIENIATLAGKMHAAKFAHQDFYLVHLFVKQNLEVLPIDLQRIIMGNKFKLRWQIKDLGQLLYSASDYISQTDILRFWKIYTSIVDNNLYKNISFIKKIFNKANAIKQRSSKKKIKRLQKLNKNNVMK